MNSRPDTNFRPVKIHGRKHSAKMSCRYILLFMRRVGLFLSLKAGRSLMKGGRTACLFLARPRTLRGFVALLMLSDDA